MADDDEQEAPDDRQEYYFDTIQRIVEEQKEFLGPEIALKQARRAPLDIDDSGNVVDFYGRGSDALETLRNFTEHQEFYLEAIRSIVSEVASFFGEKMALGYARRAPLEVSADGEVLAYYGKGRKALEILVNNLEDDIGKDAADARIKRALSYVPEEKRSLLPERLRPEKGSEHGTTFLQRIKTLLTGGLITATS